MSLAIRERVLTEVLREQVDRGPAARARHDEVAGIAQAYVVTRVAQLYRDGRIDDAGRDACTRFYAAWALGTQRAAEAPSPSGIRSDFAGELRYLAALQRYRQACEAVGPRAAAILTWLVCEERTWGWIAGRLRDVEGRRCDEATARVLACMCIKMLAEWRPPSEVRR